MKSIFYAAFLMATFAHAAIVEHVPTHRLLLVARDDQRIVEAYDDRFATRVWSTEGVAAPRFSAISEQGNLVAFADPIENEVAIITTAERITHRHGVPQTPVAMRFIGDSLYVLSRDARSLTRISGHSTASIEVVESPTHLVQRDHRLFVYSALEGIIEEYDPETLTRLRSARVPPFASDFEADSRRGYLVYPRSGKMVTLSLADLKQQSESTIGAVPVDIALEGDANLISAGVVSVADPSSKRIWRVERSQSELEAFGRGFLRGLLGLGLYSPSSTEFPTGVDRVWSDGGRKFAYDSSSGRLYQLIRGKGRVVAQLSSPFAAAVANDRLAVWNAERKIIEFRRLD